MNRCSQLVPLLLFVLSANLVSSQYTYVDEAYMLDQETNSLLKVSIDQLTKTATQTTVCSFSSSRSFDDGWYDPVRGYYYAFELQEVLLCYIELFRLNVATCAVTDIGSVDYCGLGDDEHLWMSWNWADSVPYMLYLDYGNDDIYVYSVDVAALDYTNLCQDVNSNAPYYFGADPATGLFYTTFGTQSLGPVNTSTCSISAGAVTTPMLKSKVRTMAYDPCLQKMFLVAQCSSECNTTMAQIFEFDPTTGSTVLYGLLPQQNVVGLSFITSSCPPPLPTQPTVTFTLQLQLAGTSYTGNLTVDFIKDIARTLRVSLNSVRILSFGPITLPPAPAPVVAVKDTLADTIVIYSVELCDDASYSNDCVDSGIIIQDMQLAVDNTSSALYQGDVTCYTDTDSLVLVDVVEAPSISISKSTSISTSHSHSLSSSHSHSLSSSHSTSTSRSRSSSVIISTEESSSERHSSPTHLESSVSLSTASKFAIPATVPLLIALIAFA
ncbi:hypothetical protein Pelo_14611 [Pelomyxa schiedti]|nr:hypothetical protein Pelo_14611 [Pelomyxa schiedti]